MTSLKMLFWASAAFVAYTYAGYPVLVWLLSRLRRPVDCPPLDATALPQVTVVMAAYNEARRIREKIDNLRALDYPADRLDILVVSDGSTDGTAQLLQALPGVRTIACPQRRGKAHALNLAMAAVHAPFTVFCDVRQAIAPDAVRHLMSDFCLPNIGAVSGELIHRPSGTHAGQTIGLYWRYEKWIRKAESRLHSTVGATGALYAIRTADFAPLGDNTILDDFEVPMGTVRRGKRILLDPRAQVYDVLQTESAAEQRRKIRTLTGNFQTFLRHPWLFVPWANPAWFQFMSHKVFRLLVPYAMILALLCSAVLASPVYRMALALQLAFYTLAALAHWAPSTRRNKFVSLAHVFFDMNAAAVIAAMQFARGRTDARWEKM